MHEIFSVLFPGIPSVSVTYSAIWVFGEVFTSKCSNISSLLDNLQETLEETLAQNCRLLNINATVQFTHSFLAFEVCLSIQKYIKLGDPPPPLFFT